MPTYLKTLILDQISPDSLSGENFLFASRLELPFRLRVGKCRRFAIAEAVDLWVFNQVDVPDTEASSRLLREASISALRSHVVITEKGEVNAEDVDAVKRALVGGGNVPFIHRATRRFAEPRQVLNDLLIAYHSATRIVTSIGVIEPFTPMQFFEHLTWQLTLVVAAGRGLLADEIQHICELTPDFVAETGVVGGDFQDLPAAAMTAIEAAVGRHRQYLFYEYALEAHSHRLQDDPVGALLYMVIAFEAAHAALIHLALPEMVEGPKKKEVEGLANTLLREHGISALYKLSDFSITPWKLVFAKTANNALLRAWQGSPAPRLFLA